MGRAEGVEKAREIVRQAMADRALYDRMADREAEVWGKILPVRERAVASEEDVRAAEALGIRKKVLKLEEWVIEHGLEWEAGLTLGCGEGRAERQLQAKGVCQRFHGIDISPDAVVEAQRVADKEGLPFTYEVADINFLTLPEATYDLVVAQTCLHHILFLEHVAEQVWRTLKPDGYLWLHDYIGEMQFQYDEERLELVNRLLAILPEKFRHNRINNRVVAEIKRPEPGRLVSPFESIRSEDILPVFKRWFTVEWSEEFGAITHLVVPPGTRSAYLESDDTRALYDVLSLLDEVCLKTGLLRPAGGMYLMRRRSDLRHDAPIGS